MTAEAFSSIPFSAGGAVAAALGRAALTAVALFMRAPLRNAAIAGLVTLSVVAGSNALYKQAHHHPSPLFGNFETTAQSQGADPVMPAARPKELEAAPVKATVIEKPALISKTVSNDDVFEIQRKLQAFGMLDGKVDGLFGPRTIRAIKVFEAKVGQPVRGQLTPEIVALIKSTPIFATPDTIVAPQAPASAVEVVPAATDASSATETPAPLALVDSSAPAKFTAAVVEPVEEDPLPAPAPLLSATGADTATTDRTEITAAIAASTDTVAVTADAPALPVNAVTKRTVQTIAVRAAHANMTAIATPEAAQEMPAALDGPAANMSIDTKVVAAVQRGLASLGFLHGEADGVAGEATAKAIRNFEIYFNYTVTGRISPDLVNLLVQNGAVI